LPESTKSSHPDDGFWAVILAGGAGTRFWPISTPQRPKQLLPLGQGASLIEDTVDRLEPLVGKERLRILTGRHLAGPLLQQVASLSTEQLMVEPEARGTAPVLAWAAHTIAQREPLAVMASLHSDHVIRPARAFRTQLQQAAEFARAEQRLVTFGVSPTRPETGYGYIRVGTRVGGDDSEIYEVAQFVEKPTRETASDYVRRGFLWNSGIFVWPVQLFLEELKRAAPRLGALLPLLDQGNVAEFFASAPTISVDEAVLEKSDRVVVMPTRFEWDDVGAWDAVGRTRHADADGNVSVGQTFPVDAHNCIAWSEDGAIVLFGVNDLVVVRAGGVTLVTARERTPELKSLLKQLPRQLRDLAGDE
jgi:mannose-1-phosphate guanylyltransferase